MMQDPNKIRNRAYEWRKANNIPYLQYYLGRNEPVGDLNFDHGYDNNASPQHPPNS